MSDSKIKIKDLATELKMDAKELLQELQSMGFNVKSAQGSIPMEEVSGVRDRVAENRQRKARPQGRSAHGHRAPPPREGRSPGRGTAVAGTRAEAAPEKAPDPAAPVETPAARVISVPEPKRLPGASRTCEGRTQGRKDSRTRRPGGNARCPRGGRPRGRKGS